MKWQIPGHLAVSPACERQANSKRKGADILEFYTTAVSAGLTVYEHRALVSKAFRRIRNWLKNGKVRIVVFGPGGTGKTTLGAVLSGKFEAGKSSKYVESFDIEKYKKKGDVPCELIVGPGQERRRIGTWDEIYRALVKGKSRGIINVVSYGYHSFEKIGYQDLKQFHKGMTKGQVFSKYLDDNRREELRVLDEIIPHLLVADKELWMITLVTKQDLWWKKRKQVQKFYSSGEYNEKIEKIYARLGETRFHHEYLSTSLVMANLIDGKGEPLALTAGGYDELLQIANMENSLNAIDTLMTGKKKC